MKNKYHIIVCCFILYLISRYISYEADNDYTKGHNVTEDKILSNLRKALQSPKSRSIPYHLNNKGLTYFSQFGQDELVAFLFNNKVNGFFIEAGAFKGEDISNTLFLERNLNWTGLLIEPVPPTFQILASKNRKAYIINACISPTGKEEIVRIGKHPNDAALSHIENGPLSEEGIKKKQFNVTCYSLESMLDEIGNPVVDFFSLDVEGLELAILKSIPWGKIKMRLICVEVKHVPEGKKAVKTYMEGKGFKFYKKIENDYFFYNPELFENIDLSKSDLEHL